jgi:Holliday junction resolvase RusA-like endonuclease
MELKEQPSEFRSKSYCVNVNPIAWQRPGLNGKRFFDAQQKDKVYFGLYLLKQHNGEPLFSRAISLDVEFYMPIKLTLKVRRPNTTYHKTVPDIDNLCKFLTDAIKGVIILDDRLIVSLTAKKLYSSQPRTEFTIKEVE